MRNDLKKGSVVIIQAHITQKNLRWINLKKITSVAFKYTGASKIRFYLLLMKLFFF